jgi:hypothetical protein
MKIRAILMFLCLLVVAGCSITVEELDKGKGVDQSERIREFATFRVEPEYDFSVQVTRKESGFARLFDDEVSRISSRRTKEMKSWLEGSLEFCLGQLGLEESESGYDLHVFYVPFFSARTKAGGGTTSTMNIAIVGYDVDARKRIFEVLGSYEVNHSFGEGTIHQIVAKTLKQLEIFEDVSLNRSEG